MLIHDRIASRRREIGLSQVALAKKTGVSGTSVSKWESGFNQPKGRYLNDLAAALGVSVDWLLTGKEKGATGVAESPFFSYRNVGPAVITQGGRVPILSYVQAGNWREMCEQATTFDGNVEYVTASVDIGPCGFGLHVCGNAMEPEFKEGNLLIVDPDESPYAGAFVVAKGGSGEVTFKKYRSRGVYDDGNPRFELVPLNDDYETISTDHTAISIIGVVVEHRRTFKPEGRALTDIRPEDSRPRVVHR